jgi:antitoxin HigA-1
MESAWNQNACKATLYGIQACRDEPMRTPAAATSEPPHPGGFLKGAIVEANALSVTKTAEVLGVTRAALSALLNGRSHLSSEMALRVEKAFGLSMDHLMWMQTEFDIAEARKRTKQILVGRFRPRAGTAPAKKRP